MTDRLHDDTSLPRDVERKTPDSRSSGHGLDGEGSCFSPPRSQPEGTDRRRETDLGDLVIVLLAGTLTGLRDRLAADGFPRAAALVNDLANLADAYIEAGES